MVRRGLITALLAGAAVTPASAQDLDLRLHGGIVQPVAATGDYFKLGPSVSVEALYPLSDALGLTVDLGWDYLNTQDIYPTPTTNLWRYRVGVEAGLFGDEDGFQVKAVGAAGGTTVKSHNFWLASRQPYTYEGETINETGLTANGGVRLGWVTSDGIDWWLTTKLNWSPIAEENQDALQELARAELDPLGSSLLATITLGVSLW
jgi:hypothetical protein